VATTLKRPFVAIGEQLTPLITLRCKEKDFLQSGTELALHMVCAKREGTYEIILKVDVLYIFFNLDIHCCFINTLKCEIYLK